MVDQGRQGLQLIGLRERRKISKFFWQTFVAKMIERPRSMINLATGVTSSPLRLNFTDHVLLMTILEPYSVLVDERFGLQGELQRWLGSFILGRFLGDGT